MARDRTAVLRPTDPLASLTPGERVAYDLVPVTRYGANGVATFRAYLLSVALRRQRGEPERTFRAPVFDGA